MIVYCCRVLISAVNKATTKPKLHFFNNCFGDEYMDRKSIYNNNEFLCLLYISQG